MDEMKVTLSFSRAVLFALLDPENALADSVEAQRLGLLNKKRELTPIGQLTLAACDVVYLHHKLIISVRNTQEG